jgi:ribonuclease-3
LALKSEADIGQKLNYSFKNKKLLARALTRKAFANENPAISDELGDQDTLRVIGSAVIDLFVLEHFYLHEEESSRKDLDEYRRKYGNLFTLAVIANSIQLQEYVSWGNIEIQRGLWDLEKSDAVGECFEAIAGAIYLDGGMKAISHVFRDLKFFGTVEE